jgi:hypothetical protein
MEPVPPASARAGSRRNLWIGIGLAWVAMMFTCHRVAKRSAFDPAAREAEPLGDTRSVESRSGRGAFLASIREVYVPVNYAQMVANAQRAIVTKGYGEVTRDDMGPGFLYADREGRRYVLAYTDLALLARRSKTFARTSVLRCLADVAADAQADGIVFDIERSDEALAIAKDDIAARIEELRAQGRREDELPYTVERLMDGAKSP